MAPRRLSAQPEQELYPWTPEKGGTIRFSLPVNNDGGGRACYPEWATGIGRLRRPHAGMNVSR
ncbi:MAG: hypothetical protein HPZ91_08150 [Lentisphaeria bacterium]|nr:hypothetical protein [Lentisphaeria bacterium]